MQPGWENLSVPPASAADHPADRRRAAIAGHTGDSSTARSLLGHPDPKVRGTALGALNRLDDLDAGELIDALGDTDASVRRRACEETARWMPGGDGDQRSPQRRTPLLDPPPALPGGVGDALVRLLFDEDPTVVETAAWAWGERPPAPTTALDRLIELATDHTDALCREAAVASLGALGDPRGLPAILAATRDRATVRRRAVIALAPFDGPEVEAAIATARTDRDWQVRQAAEDLSP